jgi:hypothetical protein
MRRHITIGCALAAGALLLTACNSGGMPPANGGSTSSFFAQSGRSGLSPAAANVLKNPCFSTGKLTPWKATGKNPGDAVISKKEVWDCPYAAFMGTTKPPAVNGLHAIEQSVKIPPKATLTFWYYGSSNDEPKYGDQEVDLQLNGKTVYQCFKSLVKTKKWTMGKCSLSKYAGKTYELVLGVNDNGYSKTYVDWYVDDLSLQ